MTLPKEPLEPTKINPDLLVLYGVNLCGKTTFAIQLPNHLLLDFDGTAGFYKCCHVRITNYNELVDVILAIEKAGKPYKHLIIDSVTKLLEICEVQATLVYNAKLPKDKAPIRSIIDVPFSGYPALTAQFIDIVFGTPQITGLVTLAERIIFTAHARDKWDEEVTKILNVAAKTGETKNIENEPSSKVIALPNKLATSFLSQIHAIGLVLRSGKISFNGTEDSYGARCPHLRGVTIDRDWGKIYV